MLSLLFVGSLVAAERIDFQILNHCSQTIWPAISANKGAAWQLNPDALPALRAGEALTTSISLPTAEGGRLWGKQFCAEDGTNCFIGDCGAKSCWRGSAPFATLLEFSATRGNVMYDVSLGK